MPKIRLKRGSAEFEDSSVNTGRKLCRCDMPGCNEIAEYRAPKDRSLNEYYHFCLKHVEEYNRAWDFFSGMSSIEIESSICKSMYGDRPTWKYGVNAETQAKLEEQIWQTYNYSDDTSNDSDKRELPQHYQNTPEFEAMSIMGLAPPLTMEEIKTKYKQLVKLHHPDHNPDKPGAEEMLKNINMAYTILKMAYGNYEKI